MVKFVNDEMCVSGANQRHQSALALLYSCRQKIECQVVHKFSSPSSYLPLLSLTLYK